MIKIEHRNLLWYYELISKSLSEKVIEEQYKENLKAWKNHKEKMIQKNTMRDRRGAKTKLYIEKQSELADMKYGVSNKLFDILFFKGHAMSAADNSCEVIAMYNAMLALNDPFQESDFPELLKYYSKKGIAFNGVFGTSPRAITSFPKEYGYKTKTLEGALITENAVAKMAKEYQTFILVAYNIKDDISQMIHTVSITYEGNRNTSEESDLGSYVTHNTAGHYVRSATLYEAVKGFNNRKGDPVMLIGIK